MNKEMVVNIEELDGYLKKIYSIFPVDKILEEKIEIKNILDYYHKSNSVYKYVHSYQGSAHLAINYDGIFNHKGFYTQLDEISEEIKASGAKRVLELGCGKGFNLAYLAINNPAVQFLGIDITDRHLSVAKRKTSSIKNVNIQHGDFHKLVQENSSFDFVFDLEAISHAGDSKKVLSEVFRVLRRGGRFVIYDGFRQVGFDNLSSQLKKAAYLVEKSMAVNQFERIDAWLEKARQLGFRLNVEKDLSQSVMPNLAKLQLLSRKYFEFPFLSKIFIKIFSPLSMMNCIAVLLLPFTIYHKAQGYYKIILEK